MGTSKPKYTSIFQNISHSFLPTCLSNNKFGGTDRKRHVFWAKNYYVFNIEMCVDLVAFKFVELSVYQFVSNTLIKTVEIGFKKIGKIGKIKKWVTFSQSLVQEFIGARKFDPKNTSDHQEYRNVYGTTVISVKAKGRPTFENLDGINPSLKNNYKDENFYGLDIGAAAALIFGIDVKFKLGW